MFFFLIMLIVNCYIYGCASLNWYDDWIIYSYITILFEMKPIYWGLKGNQGTMVTYASICFNIELIWCVMIELYVPM